MTPFLTADLKVCEGFRARAYPDPDSELAKTGQGSGAPWTIGYGHCGLDVHPGLEWTEDQACEALRQDIATAVAGLDKALPWWRSLNDPRQDVFVQLAFNMGIHGLLEFKRMLGFAKSGAFDKASVELLNSTWASQVKTRAWRLASQLRTGLRP